MCHMCLLQRVVRVVASLIVMAAVLTLVIPAVNRSVTAVALPNRVNSVETATRQRQDSDKTATRQ